MIGMLHGRVESVDTVSALIEVGGIGYETRMPSADLASMHAGQEVRVYTSLSVSQDAITLFGFLTPASKRMFLQLQKVSGIGPKVALSLLSTLPPAPFGPCRRRRRRHRACQSAGTRQEGCAEDHSRTQRFHRSQPDRDCGVRRQSAGGHRLRTGSRRLISLGWRQQDALHAVQEVCRSNGITTPLSDENVPRVLKLALASLDRGR
ncbi:Holliday junction DNA helicase RuvA [Bifidobacterium moukalabense DSM 27321]|uniref:Holliday junction branch migration complex subunit RuvA n=1 Tax=Bifidobacterium moukalabense DSM 27321 TaxID=1435051 RepID=W4NA92_9BIFI|nr:Holliday junction DNA helicase RuvA [Bifidobacterium moukalabense DSM 27321]